MFVFVWMSNLFHISMITHNLRQNFTMDSSHQQSAMDPSKSAQPHSGVISNTDIRVCTSPTLSSMSTPGVQRLLDERHHAMTIGWKKSIPSSLFVVYGTPDSVTPSFSPFTEPVDICSYLNGQNPTVTWLCFNAQTYSPFTNDDAMKGHENKNTCSG